jgi:hypothetical protein
MNDFPCICGHEKDCHDRVLVNMWCRKCYSLYIDNKKSNGNLKPMHVYKPDNLKYLESLYESKHK